MDELTARLINKSLGPVTVTSTLDALLYGGLSGLSLGGLEVDTTAAAEHPWDIIIGLYLGALFLTFGLTCGMNWLLRACGTQERKSAILSFVIVGLVALLVGSHTMGFGKAFVIYIPCLILWLTVGLKLSQTILVHPRVLGTAFMLAGSLLVIVPLAFIYNPVPPAPLLASLPQWEVVLYAGPYCNTPPRCWDSLAVPYAYCFALGLVLGAVGIILRVAGAAQEPKT